MPDLDLSPSISSNLATPPWIASRRCSSIKSVHVDNAKEYTEGQFKAYAASPGIIIRTTAPYSPAQNGIAERLNRTLAERNASILIEILQY